MKPLIIGHRGASSVAPENTMAAFREAIAFGADGIEFDVRLTRDGVPVVIHDNNLRRTGGLANRVADLDWSELSKIDVGSTLARLKNLPVESFSGETVPSLRELFQLFQANDLVLYLEMKCDTASEEAPLAAACAKLIDEFDFKKRVIVECFRPSAIKTIKEIDPAIQTAALFDKPLPGIINQALDVRASYLALHYRIARRRLLDKAKQAGLKVAVWTVDDASWMEFARETEIDALITNCPQNFTDKRRLP